MVVIFISIPLYSNTGINGIRMNVFFATRSSPTLSVYLYLQKKNTITHEPVTALFAEKLNDKEVSVLPTELLQSVCNNLTKIVKFAKTRELFFYKTVV